MRRRDFLVTGASAVAAAAISRPDVLLARDRSPTSMALEERLAEVISAYDAKEVTARVLPLIMHQQNGWHAKYRRMGLRRSSNHSRSTGLIRNPVTCGSPIDASKECRSLTRPSPIATA